MSADADADAAAARAALRGRHTQGGLTDRVLAVPLAPLSRTWVALLALTGGGALAFFVAALLTIDRGVGLWGINIPVAWGFAIVNFVWWIGIGHAGTFISAILLLARQPWRTSINRFAEAMTLVAVAIAGTFPLLHLGRLHLFYWLVPYPNSMGVWPQWRSPLVWDVIAVGTYFTVSLLFWYLGLLPDLASLRDHAARPGVRRLAGLFALGWRGGAREWQRHQLVYLLLAGLATPLVISVHSTVSFDFAVGIVPGWHSTIFPPFFVAGAIFSGFAMVVTIALPLRAIYGLHDLITAHHLDAIGKLLLVTGLLVGLGYGMETFTALYSGEPRELHMIGRRLSGDAAPAFWATVLCNVVAIQALWSRRVRRSPLALFAISQAVNVGMWLERYLIVIKGLERDSVPALWGAFVPTAWDWALLLGSIALFATLMLLFFRLLPAISIWELRELAHGTHALADARVEPRRAARVSRATPRARPGGAPRPIYGTIATFARPEELVEAARAARAAGFERVEGYAPYPVEGLSEALGYRRSRLRWAVLAAGLLGAAGGYALQAYVAVIDYPWNVGGRALHSWPAFVPFTFELGILSAALTGFIGLLLASGLPRLHHPLFAAPEFRRASRDRFVLCIRPHPEDPLRAAPATVLERVGGARIREVPA